MSKRISDELLISDLQRVSKLNNEHYTPIKFYILHGNFNHKTVVTRFGGWTNALKKAGLVHYDDSLIGRKFGLLTVVKRTDDKDSGGYYLWECKCECGRTTHANQTDLKRSMRTSCGSVIHQGQVMRDPERWKKEVYSGYEIDKKTGLRYPDFNKKPLKNNTSGYTGVIKKGNKWAAELNVKGVKYRSYGFDTAKDAYYNGRLKLEKEHLPKEFRKNLEEKRKVNKHKKSPRKREG